MQLASIGKPIRSTVIKLRSIPIGNCCVIGSGARISLCRELPAEGDGHFTIMGFHIGENFVEITAISTYSNECAVLCSGAQHGGATNVDILNTGVKVCT